MFLVLRGTPATIDEELDPFVRGISGSLAKGTEERWIKVGHTRNLVIKDRRAVRDGTVSLAKRTAVGPVARVSASGSSGARPAAGRDDALNKAGCCRTCWSLLHPWIVRRVGVHGRATVIDGFGAQFVVPGFVAVDLA